MADFTIRPAISSDGAFLGDMVVEAANWRAGATRPQADGVRRPDLPRLPRPAGSDPRMPGSSPSTREAKPIGAAWYRLFGADTPAHGFVAAGVPELIIGVRPLWRAQGVGRSLMRALTDAARAAGYARITLSVEHGNFAHTLYRSEGFAVVGTGAGRDTMVRVLG